MCYEMQKNENNTKRVKVSTIFGLNNMGYKGIFRISSFNGEDGIEEQTRNGKIKTILLVLTSF